MKESEIDSSFKILHEPWKNIESEVLKEIMTIYPEVSKKTLFIVPPKGIDEVKIPVLQKGICVKMELDNMIINTNVKTDYSYLLNFLLIRKDA